MTGYLQFWGKAREARLGEAPFHPVAYHCLDVAAAAEALLARSPRRLAHMARLLGSTSHNARRLIVAMIALHDIGKFSDAFQGKVEVHWPREVLGDPQHSKRRESSVRHDETAHNLFDKLDLPKLFRGAFLDLGRPRAQVAALWAGVAWHHGKPGKALGEYSQANEMSQAGLDSALAFARDVVALFGPFEPLDKPTEKRLGVLSWALAGLTNLADWIGSNREAFPYTKGERSLSEYWTLAQQRAETALDRAGLQPARAAPGITLQRLLARDVTPSPLQDAMAHVSLPDGPMLAIVEDVTGSGKTEAALLLASRLMTDDRADGLFFALPTMATANAMFERLGKSYRRLFEDHPDPSLVLAHGRRDLNPGFTGSILEGAEASAHERLTEATGDESSATCAAWIADDRRKAFLAQVGAGTIDQAFLAALPAKHQALRLWGLADRVLIVDEAHAYDAYMTKELHRVLEFHAALGGSAIVLSATLPARQREELATAFASGLGVAPEIDAVHDYPLVTTVSAAGVTAATVATRGDRTRRLPVRTVRSEAEAMAHIVAMAERGAAVAWIRNSVDDAIEAVEALQRQGLQPTLLHARFAMGDRLQIEDDVRTRLGRDGNVEARKGFVLIGTQILEQSLDYDVDAMVTDLAPVDLVIQRAGRLWRHTDRAGRPLDAPELVVFAPDWQAVSDASWYAQISRRAAAVYRHHGIVWRSAKALDQAGAIVTPGIPMEADSVRRLIESVYGSDEFDDVPRELLNAANLATGRDYAAKDTAKSNLLVVKDGYGGNNQAWSSDQSTPTRLTELATLFRLGRIEGGRIVPWCTAADGNLRRSWALSEVSLSQRKAIDVPPPLRELKAMIAEAKATWPEWEREQPLLVLTPNGTSHSGEILTEDKAAKTVMYDAKLGLRILM